MKNNEVVHAELPDAIDRVSQLNAAETGVVSKFGRQLKKIIFLTGLAGIALSFNACMTSGYVTTEPGYVEYSRPPQPSNLHVWVNNDWGWNRSSHVYVQKKGYWQQPAQGRTYVSGHWTVTPKGHTWAPGRWKKEHR